jgi:sec-independent protein translocase protein TatA
MNFGDLFDSPLKILIVAIVIIVLFGSAKLPVAARSLGRSMRILKSEVSGLHDDDEERAAQATAQPVVATQQIAAPQPVAPVVPPAQPAPVQPVVQPADQVTTQAQIDSLQQQIRALKDKETASVPADQKPV